MACDVIVVGSGAAGLTAAITAAHSGLKVLVLEKYEYFGGTTGVSGGGVWIPGNMYAGSGTEGSRAAARRYILGVVGDGARPELIDAYLDRGPEMLAFLAVRAGVQLAASQGWDLYPEIEGASSVGRLLSTPIYDGRKLGPRFAELVPARREFNAPGGFMIDPSDFPHLDGMGKNVKSTLHMARLGLRFLADRLRGYSRGTRLTMGNALAARLFRSAIDAGVDLRASSPVAGLVIENGCVKGVSVSIDGKREALRADKGVILATGGWSANPHLRQAYMPHPDHHVSVTQPGSTGDGINMALEAGAVLGESNPANGVWSVVSTLNRADGRAVHHLHLLDMAKPGCIAVNAAGRRFGNEASLHFVTAMHRTGSTPAWLIADSACVRKYGLGMIRPGARNLRRLLNAGYVIEGASVADIAAKTGVDLPGLNAAIAQVNTDAATGKDSAFGKGDWEGDRKMGDPRHRPNPCFGPVGDGPLYAVKITPGDGASTVGLTIDPQARVLDRQDAPILGLYAAGVDAHSIWRGRNPAQGTNIGPGMVFGYIAACSLVADSRDPDAAAKGE